MSLIRQQFRLLILALVATAALVVPSGALAAPSLSVVAGADPAAAGVEDVALVTYTVTVGGDPNLNEGATGVQATSTFTDSDVNVEYGYFEGAAIGECDYNTVAGAISCPLGDLDAGDVVTVNIGLSRVATAPANVTVTHTATGQGASDVPPNLPVTDSDTSTVAFTGQASIGISGGYADGDADGEQGGAAYREDQTVPFLVDVANAAGGAAAQNVTLRYSFYTNDSEATAEFGTVAVDNVALGAGACTSDESSISCNIGDVAAGSTVTVRVPVAFSGLGEEDSAIQSNFSIETLTDDASVADNEVDEETSIEAFHSPVCLQYATDTSTTFTAVAAAGGKVTTGLPCNDDGAITYSQVSAVQHLTLSGQNGTALTFTVDPATLNARVGFQEAVTVRATDNDGLTTDIVIYVTINSVSDLSITSITGPATLATPTSGASATYTAALTNLSGDATGKAIVYWQFPRGTKVVSATNAAGAAVTCPNFQQSGGPDSPVYAGCPVGTVPAAGSSTTSTITVSFVPGSGAITTPPSTQTIRADAGFSFPDTFATDPNVENNPRTFVTSLTVPTTTTCATGQTGTPPNCLTTGTAGNDVVNGTTGDDRWDGGAGNDVFRGGEGNDVGIGGLGNDKLFGGLGNDLLNGGAGVDSLFGESGNDKLLAGAGNDLADGGSGNDVITGDAGNDRLFGGLGNDRESGGVGNDAVYGQAGTDLLYCNSGKDLADGGAGNDGVNCADGTGGDKVYGGLGRDFCIGDPGDIFVGCETRIIK
ncbi:MAG: hypothetical protein JWM98_572 [Thermoleophilia bacterium]|nr:hypothetical protein [Thermoleophilia bacterium]